MLPLAYIISAYKNPEQLIRLISRLYRDDTVFLVHVDKQTKKNVYDRIVVSTKDLPNVHLLKQHSCYWGEFGHVEATLEGISALIRLGIRFEYAFLLTGQDYPIKSNTMIEEFLLQNKGSSFMEYFPLPFDEWENGGLDRVKNWYIRCFDRRFILPGNGYFPLVRKFPRGFRPFGGSSYWCLTKDCIDYIYRFIQTHPTFVRFFKYVDVPDEIFFQTILINSPLASSIVNDDLRYIDWKDLDSGSPSVLDKNDFEKIAGSPKLFARKFDIHVDSDVLDMIDEEILSEQVATVS